MAVKFDHECSRCHKTVSTKTGTAAQAAALEEHINKKQVGAKKLWALVEELKANGELPDVFAVTHHGAVIHPYLCPDTGETKRSCSRRINDLMSAMTELDERKPRKKKGEGDTEIEVTETPANPPTAE